MSGYKTFSLGKQTDFEFLIKKGLKPDHSFLDVGCGGGRLGNQAISYLNKDKYFAFDKENSMINPFLSILKKFPALQEKNPTIRLSDFNIEFEDSVVFDFIYAYSVFTHVTPDLIVLFMKNLKKHFSIHTKFFASFLLGSEGYERGKPHLDRKGEYAGVWYTVDFLKRTLFLEGYNVEFVGDSEFNWEGVKRELYGKNSRDLQYTHKNSSRFSPYDVSPEMLPKGYQYTHGPHQEMILITKNE
jgi:SAM-dependent methyltransferase